MTEKITLQGMTPPRKTPAGPPPVASVEPIASDSQAAHREEPLPDATALTPPPAKAAGEPPLNAPAAKAEPEPSPEASEKEAPEKPAPKPKRGPSVAQKAIIAERTDRILKSAKPGSAEYADACRDRAEAGLVVPAMKHTAISLHAFEQFANMAAADERAAHQKVVRKTALAVIAGLVVLAAALGAFLLFTHDPNAKANATSTVAASAGTTTPGAAPKTAKTPPPEPTQAASSQTDSAAPIASASNAPANSARPTSNAQPKPNAPRSTGSLPTSTPSSVPSSKPTSNWEPSWVAPK